MQNNNVIAIICGIAVAITAGILFGWTGIMTVLGMLILYFVPAYIVLRNLDLDNLELLVFSFFLGFGLFPIITYYINKLVGSLRVSVFLTFVVIVAVGVIIRVTKKKTKTSSA
ncbi:MAG: hypothetical protein V1837_08485 [Candidatus Woesearchaeota archaeon]